MASSSHYTSDDSDEFEDVLDESFDAIFERKFEEAYEEIIERLATAKKKKKKKAYIEREREQGQIRLWNDYFSEDAIYPPHIFRRRFRMNKTLFMRIVDRLSEEVPYFQQRRNATGRLGLSALQKCTAAIRMMAYGCEADAVDEYLRIGESTAILCLENFTSSIIELFGDQYLRRPTPEDLKHLLDVGESRGFSGMI
ncbi:uncharacterized protein LOC112088419 [Eutrema salsugineum]|uniref:uncharacterized protein LOC112088419 n=1 Tax=Eutrema salsugineum TaxID=72664 RepID=UPI000CED522F|nr:uncharacterized protein LOC112088419 [Eutrema salsugineum]